MIKWLKWLNVPIPLHVSFVLMFHSPQLRRWPKPGGGGFIFVELHDISQMPAAWFFHILFVHVD